MKAGLALVCLCISLTAFGQRDVSDRSGWSLKDRIYLGGGLGFNGGTDSYGNRFFYWSLYPIVGYMITPQFSGGLGIQWQHYNYPDINESLDQYGFSPFVRYNLGKMFAYSEYSFVNAPFLGTNDRANYRRFLLGLGYSMPLGGRSKVNAMGLYDVIYKANGPFGTPWVFRVFFSF